MSDGYNSDGLIERTLSLVNFGEDEATRKIIKTRVTLAPASIKCVIASEDTVQKAEGREQHKVNVLFMDGDQLELFITALDLATLERAIGIYFTS